MSKTSRPRLDDLQPAYSSRTALQQACVEQMGDGQQIQQLFGFARRLF